MRLLINALLNLAVLWLAFRRFLSALGFAESSILWNTGTTGDGTSTYTETQSTAHWGDWFTPNSTITNPHASQGVLAGAGGELAVTGTSSPVAVAAGAAIVEGFPYRNTASVNVTIPTPAGSTRIDRIVLRVSHSTTRTVRITRIAGTEGAGAPSLTQTAGTTWDIPLAQVSITTGGVITVTDQRSFCHFATWMDFTRVDGGTVNRVPFFASSGQLTSDADLTFDGTTLALVGNLTLDGSPIPNLYRRQGGSSSAWATAGTTTYTPSGGVIEQVGVASISGPTIVTFPVAFSNTPVLVATALHATTTCFAYLKAISASQFTVNAKDDTGADANCNIHWHAIGPE